MPISRDIKELDLKELEGVLRQWQEKPFHSEQIFSWIYKRHVTDFGQMSDLAAGLREKLKENFYIAGIKLVKDEISRDGTIKFLFGLKDKNLIEAVIIPAEERITGCISSQVGCKYACKFCASGKLGFKRNLTRGEILDEALYLKKESDEKLTHVVFMGIGEPLDNYENVLGAIHIINSKEGLNIGARRITISTCGIVPGIKRLAEEGLQVELSISLHAADDKTRDRLMPINKKYPLKTLISACKDYIARTNRQVTIEYILIKDLNCGLQSAEDLSKMLKGVDFKVNLIPANPLPEYEIVAPNKLDILLFKDKLSKSGINVTLRKPRGQDIAAACGQLRLRYAE
ncbi:MAG: 23S rRNA (adenine(2503)-C(2))-methyltransferase RlmN [Candidatus Omnitrophota bacterium]